MAIHSLDIVVYAGLGLRAHVSGSGSAERRDRSARRPGTDRGVPARRISSAQREKRVLAAREILIVPFVVLRGLLGELESGVLAFARDAILTDNE
jgi:hypothetical protein